MVSITWEPEYICNLFFILFYAIYESDHEVELGVWGQYKGNEVLGSVTVREGKSYFKNLKFFRQNPTGMTTERVPKTGLTVTWSLMPTASH